MKQIWHQIRIGLGHHAEQQRDRGGCPIEVGRRDKNVCVSRTDVVPKAAPPFRYRNVRKACVGAGCPYSTESDITLWG